ncbi:hypothetical protein MMC27_007897 [Xylographa pallens]|nr:hypothetical protein [Xylographa pallens]
MDTSAYLTNQGWRGLGYALHPTGRGIKKPLLVSQKSNVLGIGKKKHDAHADQWWARALDNSLKGLEVGHNGVSGATESVEFGAWGSWDMIKAGGEKLTGKGGLYAGFVRGEGLSGTIASESPATEESDSGMTKEIQTQGTVERLSKKRKRTVGKHRVVDAKAERLTRREKAATTTQAGYEGGKIIEDSNTTLVTLLSKEERLHDMTQRHEERRSREARSVEIDQPVFRPDVVDGPKLGKERRKRDKAGVLGSPQALIATKSPEDENDWRHNPAGALSEYRVEKRRKKGRRRLDRA